MNFIPIGKRVLIKPLTKEEIEGKPVSSIILPETASKERPEQGIIVSVGDKVGEKIKEGQTVLFAKYGPQEITIEKEIYLIAEVEDIFCIINND